MRFQILKAISTEKAVKFTYTFLQNIVLDYS